MTTKNVRIDADVRAVLERATVAGNVLTLAPEQLERELYVRVDKALKAAGGKWDRRAGGHVFAFDPSTLLGQAIEDGAVVNRQQTLQLFETPAVLVARMLDLVPHGGRALEPSAGRGRIAFPLAEIASSVVAVEIDPLNAEALREGAPANVEVVETDFLAWAPDAHFDVIVMNPPFTRGQDMEHIRSAFDHLAPGGVLVSIASEGGFIREDAQSVRFRTWLDRLGGTSEQLPPDTFKESGTTSRSRLVTVSRPPAPSLQGANEK